MSNRMIPRFKVCRFVTTDIFIDNVKKNEKYINSIFAHRNKFSFVFLPCDNFDKLDLECIVESLLDLTDGLNLDLYIFFPLKYRIHMYREIEFINLFITASLTRNIVLSNAKKIRNTYHALDYD